MSVNSNYLIVKDDHLGWCKVYRSDSDTIPPGEVLWRGDNLDIAYDNMKTINDQHRKVNVYSIAERTSDAGRQIFRIYKQNPELPWQAIATATDYQQARARVNELCAKRDEEENRLFELKMAPLRRLGVSSTKIPKLTEKDVAYIQWMRSSGRLDEENQQKFDWLEESGNLTTMTA